MNRSALTPIPDYRQALAQLRRAFPQPVSDREHDAYFVCSIMRALDQIDQMKSTAPVLGQAINLDYSRARQARIAEHMSDLDTVAHDAVEYLRGMPIWGHPNNQINVIGPPTIASIIGTLLPSIYNPNLVSDDTAYGIALAEHAVTAMVAELIGYDVEQALGLCTFGGTATVLYGTKLGLEKACPQTRVEGICDDAVVLVSGQGHYCALNVANWLGLGEQRVIEIPTSADNGIRLDLLERALRYQLNHGRRIAAIIATMGSTDAFGIDDLGAIITLRDRMQREFALDYRPHVHADAVIGWAWTVFDDYDMADNPLGFSPRTIHALAAINRHMSNLHLADSVGIDFHKSGFCPYTSSLFLLRQHDEMKLLTRQREQMPYLFQSGHYHPGMYTLETSRSGCGVLAALANLQLFGKIGLRCLLGHLVEMTQLLREHLEGQACTTVVNGDNFGTVTLFRVYPDGVDTWTIGERERSDPAYRERLRGFNDYNRRIMHYLRTQALEGHGVLISMTDCYRHSDYGEPISALKSYMLSPFIDRQHITALVDAVLEARQHVS